MWTKNEPTHPRNPRVTSTPTDGEGGAPMSQNCRSRAPHWRALPSRTRAPNPPFRRVGRDRAFGAAWPDGGLWRKRARPGIMRAQLCERRAGVTRLPKKFGSLPYRFVALVALVVWAPLAAVVGATGGALLAVVCGVLVALYAVLVMWRVGIVATADGVRLRGYVRNRHIHWQDVDRFEDEDTDGSSYALVACIRSPSTRTRRHHVRSRRDR